ncbi:MAG: DUF3160 domain-containing protein, partial [Candidatus Hodarchaeales archaeon]
MINSRHHTNPDPTEKTLEIATDYLEHLIVILPGWNGTDILAVGPVFSYYEFLIPMEDRMTDEDWRTILVTRMNETLSQNIDFTIYTRGFWAQNYMTSTEMTTSIIYEEGDIVGSDWEITEDNPDLNQPSNQPQTSEYIANR